MQDRYGSALSTNSAAAADAFGEGLDLYLGAQTGVEDKLKQAIAHDPNLASAHIALARHYQSFGRGAEIAAPLAAARAATGLSTQEQGQVHALGLLLEGRGAEAFKAINAHLADYPRDALVSQPCMGVFGLIGFSGRAGREAEMLAFTTSLARHYGDDWWFLSAHAFAQMEAGQTVQATETIEKSLAGNAQSANGAHYRAHLYYEVGEAEAGYEYLTEWRRDYGRGGLLHCHTGWHIGLWALARGDVDAMWRVVDADVAPGPESGPPLNVLTDMAAILYRAELAGVEVAPERWQRVSEYASKFFPNPGLAFADVHAALAHAMAGRGEALSKIVEGAVGLAGDVVRSLGGAFGALGAGRWAEAAAGLTTVMADHERIGGSRAQRDLIEFALLSALLKQNKTEEARRLLAMRRPVATTPDMIAGLAA
ncbi:MAG: tetratricopeptide repeat protein [Pikeienuella sp.]